MKRAPDPKAGAKRIALAGLFAVLSACASVALPPATTGQLALAKARWPDATGAQLEEGRRVYRARCGSCHLLPEPRSVAEAEWPSVIDEMASEARLSATEREQILRYLWATTRLLPAG